MCPQVCDKSGYQRKLSVDVDRRSARDPAFSPRPVGEREAKPLVNVPTYSNPPLRCFTILSRRLWRKTRYVTWWNHHEISLDASNAGCLFSQSDAEKIAKYAHDQFGGRWILESRNIDVQPVIGAI